jgi:hypothetical protein
MSSTHPNYIEFDSKSKMDFFLSTMERKGHDHIEFFTAKEKLGERLLSRMLSLSHGPIISVVACREECGNEHYAVVTNVPLMRLQYFTLLLTTFAMLLSAYLLFLHPNSNSPLGYFALSLAVLSFVMAVHGIARWVRFNNSIAKTL